MSPYPTISTVLSASDGRQPWCHVPVVLVVDEARDAAQRGERQGQRELGGRGVVDAAAVAQQHALGDLAADVVDPRGQRLHHLEPRHPGEQLALVGARGRTAARRTRTSSTDAGTSSPDRARTVS